MHAAINDKTVNLDFILASYQRKREIPKNFRTEKLAHGSEKSLLLGQAKL
jgi:hypothetical protein